MDAEFDWYPVGDQIETILRLALSRHEKIGSSVTLLEGEAFITKLRTDILQSVRSALGSVS